MQHAITRRTLIAGLATGIYGMTRRAGAATSPAWSYPLARNGGIPGDGFFIKHGFGCENPTYYPGWTHTGENWYGLEENAAGANVIAAADGTVVYADYDYPGRVVIIDHGIGFYSMYGHMEYALDVAAGDSVVRGKTLGTVLARPGEYERSHLHFEIRTFYLNDAVNGDHPRYGTNCGFRCPPGPGYWPTNAPEHPADLGWLNPTHVIARRMFSGDVAEANASVVVPGTVTPGRMAAWSEVPWREGSREMGAIPVAAGTRFRLLGVKSGTEAARGRSAAGYRLWYRIESPSGEPVWVSALSPDATNRNVDGSPAGVRFNLAP